MESWLVPLKYTIKIYHFNQNVHKLTLTGHHSFLFLDHLLGKGGVKKPPPPRFKPGTSRTTGTVYLKGGCAHFDMCIFHSKLTDLDPKTHFCKIYLKVTFHYLSRGKGRGKLGNGEQRGMANTSFPAKVEKRAQWN